MRDLVFGSYLDGRVWPETVDGTDSVVGSAIVGPLGLVDIVETVLGTRRPTVVPVRRIAAMQAKLAATSNDRFWSRSFVADPWATARLVLAWRDELVLAGWSRSAGPANSSRIDDIAAAEGTGPDLPPGFADRCAAATAALRAERGFPWHSLTLTEPKELLDHGIGRLVDAIGHCGVEVRASPEPPLAAGDLGRVQRLLAGGKPEVLEGDGSVIIVHGDTEITAADGLASWMAAGPRPQGGTVFVLGTATGLLDAALARFGLPRFGHSPESPSRAALQVLRLAFATRWAPFDPSALMELLLLPQGPVPKSVAGVLARTLADVPGRGSAAWTEALLKCTDIRRARFERDGLKGVELTKRLRLDHGRWRAWVQGTVHDPVVGIPAEEAQRVCVMVAGWTASSGDGDPLRMAATRAASDLALAIREMGQMSVPRNLLSRMMDEAIGCGLPDPAVVAEAAPWSAVHFPGALWSRADTVVWWAPAAAVAPRSGPWTLAEVEALADCGYRIRDGVTSLAAAARAWRQPIMQAGRQLVLVLSRMLDGGQADVHPLMHELAPLLRKVPPGVVFRAEELLHGTHCIAGRSAARVKVGRKTVPSPTRMWPSRAAVPPPMTGSATSIEKLLGCRFAWTLEHAARLAPGSRASIPKGDRLIGLLAHAVARDVLLPGEPPAPDNARERARVALEGLLESEAAPLLLPGHASDLARARRLVPAAMEHLASALARADLRILGAEVPVGGGPTDLLGNAVLRGRVDLLLENAAQARVVLDMKWNAQVRYRRDEVAEGRAVQLATYARLQPRDRPATAAYFMLAQSRFLAADTWPFSDAHVGGGGLADTWTRIVTGWTAALRALAGGDIDAPGVGDGKPDYPYGLEVPPPCGFCACGTLCGRREVV